MNPITLSSISGPWVFSREDAARIPAAGWIPAAAARPLAIECVARGYIAGSLFKEYRAEGGAVHGLSLPPGLICHHAGSVYDPDFNNVHIDIDWPR